MDFSIFEKEGWPWWSSPFNGQSRRLDNFFVLGSYLRPRFGIESGTYVGTSTHLFAGLGVEKTFSIEIVEHYAHIARARYKRSISEEFLEIICGSTQDQLKLILDKIPKEHAVMAYLDAHWESFLPTTQEINNLIDWGGAFIAIIDDFQVPDFPGYSFDVYGNTIVGPAIVPKKSEITLWLPNESEKNETGARRGTGYVISRKALEIIPFHVLEELKLREHHAVL